MRYNLALKMRKNMARTNIRDRLKKVSQHSVLAKGLLNFKQKLKNYPDMERLRNLAMCAQSRIFQGNALDIDKLRVYKYERLSNLKSVPQKTDYENLEPEAAVRFKKKNKKRSPLSKRVLTKRGDKIIAVAQGQKRVG